MQRLYRSQVEIDGGIHEVVIQIEHLSEKADVSSRMYAKSNRKRVPISPKNTR
jgi:hypothetical protein